MALGINVEYFCVYTKWIRQISYQESNLTERPLSQNCKLPTSCWHHTVLHTVNLIQIHITAIKTVTLIAVSTWNLGSAKIFPICVPVTFYIYRYHHRSIHPWALRIHIRYLSVIHKISWITQKGFIHSFRSPYADYILRTIPGIRGRLIPHIKCQEL